MKTNLTQFYIFIIAFLACSKFGTDSSAQAPQKISYQAVIRNSNSALITNSQVGLQINIPQGSSNGEIIYTETQTPTTNANGLISIEFGGNTGFSEINWANGSYFIETKLAVTAPYTMMSL